MDVVTELLSRIGELESLFHIWKGFRSTDGERRYYLNSPVFREIPGIPSVTYHLDYVFGQYVIHVPDEPRRLVLDDDFGWMWYNAEEGPVE